LKFILDVAAMANTSSSSVDNRRAMQERCNWDIEEKKLLALCEQLLK